MILEGKWAWWNQYGDLSFDMAVCTTRAKSAGLRGIVIKFGYPLVERAFTEAAIPWATERYARYVNPEGEATMLADAVAAGAVAAVINAEEGGDEVSGGHWERDWDGSHMRRLIGAFRARHPAVELYASVDTRSNRLQQPYQIAFRDHITAWLPMIYPLAFRAARPAGFVARAFADCLDGKDFYGLPVLPTIQTYDGIGPQALAEQLAEVKGRGLTGYQAYTIGHATDAEWAVIAQKEEPVPIEETRSRRRRFSAAQRHAIMTVWAKMVSLHPIESSVVGQEFFDSVNALLAPQWRAAWAALGADPAPPMPEYGNGVLVAPTRPD